MICAVYFVLVAVLIVLAVIDQPMLLIILPAGIVGSYLLLSLIVSLVSPLWRLPSHGADFDPTL